MPHKTSLTSFSTDLLELEKAIDFGKLFPWDRVMLEEQRQKTVELGHRIVELCKECLQQGKKEEQERILKLLDAAKTRAEHFMEEDKQRGITKGLVIWKIELSLLSDLKCAIEFNPSGNPKDE